MKPTLFLTTLLFAPVAEVPAAEPVTLSEDHRDAVNRQRRIFFQYDPAADIQKKGGFGSDPDAVMGYVFDFVDMPDSQLDAICIDVSNEGVAHYRSTILRPVRHPGLVKWREAGIDYFDELIKQGHRRGKEIWWGLRMNEVERGDLAGYEPGVYAELKERNPVKAAHPEWLIRSWWWQGFWNYAVKEVRDYRLSVIREVVAQYDFDGVHLDFLRHTPHLSPGKQWENRTHVTAFMREVRRMMQQRAAGRGRPLLLAARVPDTVEGCQTDGLDIETWAAQGLVDFPYYALYECATDPEMKAAADAALHFHVANMAANHCEWVIIPPANREKGSPQNTRNGMPIPWMYWFYWDDAQNWIPQDQVLEAGEDVRRFATAIYTVYAAVSSWAPPAAINSLARGQTVPYELTASAPSFGHAGISPGFWGTGTPGTCVRYVYRDKLYAMGSGSFQYYPDEFYNDYTAFRLIYMSPDKYNYIDGYHLDWRSDDRAWQGLNSPFMQMAQHKGTAIALFNIPTADPWAGRGRSDFQALRDGHFNGLIQEALIRYPKSIDQKTEANGWVFLREGHVYIAIRPLKTYTIDTNYPQAGEFDVVRSAFAQTGFIFDIATKEDFATFEAFQTAMVQNPPVVDWERLYVAYTNVRGDTLMAVWNPPNHAASPRVLVRPNITVNGTVVEMDTTYPVLRSPSVELVDRVLRLRTPAGQLEVDWRGKVPALSNQSLNAPLLAKADGVGP